MKKIKYLFIAIVLVFGFSFDVLAKEVHNTIDFSKKGSIKISLEEKMENTAVKGAEITLFKVAEAYEKDNNLAFKYTNDFKTCTASLDDLTNPELANKINVCVTDEMSGLVQTTDVNGKITLSNLDLGLYLVKQTNKVKGYSQFEPYLIMIPSVIDNSWEYNLESYPKTEIYKTIDLTVVKVWNTKVSKVSEYIEIELYKDSELVDTIKLNKQNDWTYTWFDIEKSDKYEVKEINVPEGYQVTYSKDNNLFIVTNTDTIPNTGQLFYSIIVLGSLGLICIIFGLIIIKRNEYE